MQKGKVLTGGSAGAICWFDGGHSDSMDPETYLKAMLGQKESGGDESSAAPGFFFFLKLLFPFFLSIVIIIILTRNIGEEEEAKKWEYIRVPGLGFLPGLVLFHFVFVSSVIFF